jgi:hypothetical protein
MTAIKAQENLLCDLKIFEISALKNSLQRHGESAPGPR